MKKDFCRLMIMGFIDYDDLEWAFENDISFFVFTPERLRGADGLPASYGLYQILIEIAYATGVMFVIYSGIYFFLRLVFYLSGKKKASKDNLSDEKPQHSMV